MTNNIIDKPETTPVRAEITPGDGRNVRLPHPIFQNCLFAATKLSSSTNGLRREQGKLIITRTNQWGDILTIKAPRPLVCNPDMGVFLAAMALVQENGYERLTGEYSGRFPGTLMSSFRMSDLYDLTRRTSKAKETLLYSLKSIGGVSLKIEYANSPESLRRHGNNSGVRISNIWSFIKQRQLGRTGSTIHIFPHELIMPQNKQYTLLASADLCNQLESSVARGLFWLLTCRHHISLTSQQIRNAVGSERKLRLWEWRDRQLLPALQELENYKYSVREVSKDKWTIRQPDKFNH
ncbi:MAG: hypothetical protein Q4D58_05805 [Synergistaceae bacterium]|nr:hypothetical protein [Synergistaceae bacterium]